MTTGDPRWQRGEGGWWHWPAGATAWVWIPDPPPQPAQPQVPGPQGSWPAQPSPVYVQAVEPKRRKWPWVVGSLIVLVVALAAVSSNDGPNGSAVVSTTGAADTSKKNPVGQSGLPLQDGDWRLDSLTISKEQFTGDFTGRAKVTYTGADKGGGDNFLAITIYTGANSVASMNTTINDVPPGYSKTVDFFSTDDFVAGDHRFTFQAGIF